jgi:hypothetical protein
VNRVERIGFKSFISEGAWTEIKDLVHRTLAKNADQLGITGELGGGGSLRILIEVEAGMYIDRSDPDSDLNHSRASRQARIDKMIALRDNAMMIRDSIVASGMNGVEGSDELRLPHVEANMLDASNAYIRKLTAWIDLMRSPRISIGATPTVEPSSNASKVNREEYWSGLLVIWTEIGGKQTGAAAADFLIAASRPLLGAEVPTFRSVVQWLDRRQKKLARRCL